MQKVKPSTTWRSSRSGRCFCRNAIRPNTGWTRRMDARAVLRQRVRLSLAVQLYAGMLGGRTRDDAEGVTDQRRRLLFELADAVCRVQAAGTVRVAIDGVDGAGKSCLADELAVICEAAGRAVIRASVDGFHNPRAVLPARPYVPRGVLLRLVRLCDAEGRSPRSAGSRRKPAVRVATFDHRLDCAIETPECIAASGDILLFDGIFWHRPELRSYWDYSIFLDVEFAVSILRGAQRGEGSADPDAASNRRYVRGQELYLGSAYPTRYAIVVVNNNDLDRPFVVSN